MYDKVDIPLHSPDMTKQGMFFADRRLPFYVTTDIFLNPHNDRIIYRDDRDLITIMRRIWKCVYNCRGQFGVLWYLAVYL